MPAAAEPISLALAGIGIIFFALGTLGVLRLPDLFTRLHALTKCDNLGLGFVLAAVAVHAWDPWVVLKLMAMWILGMASSATACYLVARAALRDGHQPWERAP